MSSIKFTQCFDLNYEKGCTHTHTHTHVITKENVHGFSWGHVYMVYTVQLLCVNV